MRKMKKTLSWFLAVIIVCIMSVHPANASGASDTQGTQEAVVGSEALALIEKLYDERCQLALDFDNNQRRIEEIDGELKILGVEEIPYSEVMEKLGIPTPRWNVSSTSTVSWTSVRTNTVYNGKAFQLQIVRGVPVSSSSELLRKYRTEPKEHGIGTVMKNIFSVDAVVSGIESVPVVGDATGVIHTFYDVFHSAISGMKTTSTVGAVDWVYGTSLSSQEIYVFVKHQGDEDLYNQILCYVGNDIHLETGILEMGSIEVDGRLISNVDVDKFMGDITSQYYNSYTSLACNNFWNYYYSNKDFYEDYRVTKVKLTTYAGDVFLAAPYSSPNLSPS